MLLLYDEMTTPYLLSANVAAFLIWSIPLPRPHPEDAPCRGDKGQTYLTKIMTGKVYSLQYIDIPKVLSTPYNVGHC
jgi:hypothetical protein